MTTPPTSPSNRIIHDAMEMLSDEETAAYHRFLFDRDRYLYLTAHVLLRTALSNVTSLNPADWLIHRNGYGKPFIVNSGYEWLNFNLSHTHGLAVCAIVHSCETGIDVERFERIEDPTGICEGFFTKKERDYILCDNTSEKQKRFIRMWTLKEAYIKAVGKGLSIPLDSFSVFITNENKASMQIEPGFNHTNFVCNFHMHQPTPQHHLAVAYKADSQHNFTIRYHKVELIL